MIDSRLVQTTKKGEVSVGKLTRTKREALCRQHSWEAVLYGLGIPFKARTSGVLVSLCAFHKERTPSLHYWPNAGRFFCHGCHTQGDKLDFIIRFLQRGNLWYDVDEKEAEELLDVFDRLPYPDSRQLELFNHLTL